MLTKGQKRSYVKGLRRIELGVWGYPASLFRSITLTTRQGLDMSAKRFGKDLQRLIKEYRALGHQVEYCGAFELTPGNALLHWHGLFRIKGGYFPYEVEDLSERWGRIHESPQVSMAVVWSMSLMEKYICKHIVKHSIEEVGIRNKFLVSRGWRRPGAEVVEEEFKRWWVNAEETGSWMSVGGYKVLVQTLRAWCEKGKVVVKSSGGIFFAQGIDIKSEIKSEVLE